MQLCGYAWLGGYVVTGLRSYVVTTTYYYYYYYKIDKIFPSFNKKAHYTRFWHRWSSRIVVVVVELAAWCLVRHVGLGFLWWCLV